MINLDMIKGRIGNGKEVILSKEYKSKGKLYCVDASFGRWENKIRLAIRDYDVALDDAHGFNESDVPNRRYEIKDFLTVEETLDFIFKTTIITESDFPVKFKRKTK